MDNGHTGTVPYLENRMTRIKDTLRMSGSSGR
jgi:hypothetical protein